MRAVRGISGKSAKLTSGHASQPAPLCALLSFRPPPTTTKSGLDIIDDRGDTLTGKETTLYYADDSARGGHRTSTSRTITFHRND